MKSLMIVFFLFLSGVSQAASPLDWGHLAIRAGSENELGDPSLMALNFAQAKEFCTQFSERLPTAAEWSQFAATQQNISDELGGRDFWSADETSGGAYQFSSLTGDVLLGAHSNRLAVRCVK